MDMPEIALGAWAWGNYGTFGGKQDENVLKEVFNTAMDRLEVINSKLSEISLKHDVNTAQIPIAWAIAKGTLPIICVTGKKQVEDAVKAANVELSDDEIRTIEETADRLGIDAIRFWEKEMR